MKLKDKITVVTGAGAGIGKCIAEMFSQEGAIVIASSRRESNGKPTAEGIIKAGGKAEFIRCDISVEDDVRNMLALVESKYGGVDILVNNAGVNFVKPFTDVAPSDWDRVINTDLRGTYLCSWYALPQMLKKNKGSIINITSVHSVACLPGAAPYDAAKWGVVGLTKAMAVELASRNIRVNALSPGLIDTKIWEDIKSAAPNLDDCLSFWRANIPMGRVGTAEEIAQTAVFLASDDASYITGSNIVADGGMTSQLISQEPFESKALEGEERK